MGFFVWIAIAAVLLGVQALNALHLAKLRRSGRYPERGQATMADVERLLSTGSNAVRALSNQR